MTLTTACRPRRLGSSRRDPPSTMPAPFLAAPTSTVPAASTRLEGNAIWLGAARRRLRHGPWASGGCPVAPARRSTGDRCPCWGAAPAKKVAASSASSGPESGSVAGPVARGVEGLPDDPDGEADQHPASTSTGCRLVEGAGTHMVAGRWPTATSSPSVTVWRCTRRRRAVPAGSRACVARCPAGGPGCAAVRGRSAGSRRRRGLERGQPARGWLVG